MRAEEEVVEVIGEQLFIIKENEKTHYVKLTLDSKEKNLNNLLSGLKCKELTHRNEKINGNKIEM